MVYRRLALPCSAAPLFTTPLQRHHQDARIAVAGAIADGHRVPVHLGRTTNPNGSQWISWKENLQETFPIFPWRSWDFPLFFSLNQSIEDRAKVKTCFMTITTNTMEIHGKPNEFWWSNIDFHTGGDSRPRCSMYGAGIWLPRWLGA